MPAQMLLVELCDAAGLATEVQPVTTDVLTVSDSAIVLWLNGSEVASFPSHKVASVQLSGKSWTPEAARQQHENAYRPWTPEDDDELARRHAAGESIETLATDFQRKPSAIRSRLNRLGVVPPKYADAVPAQRRGRHQAP